MKDFKKVLRANILFSFSPTQILSTFFVVFMPLMFAMNLYWQKGDTILQSIGVFTTSWLFMKIMVDRQFEEANSDRKRFSYIHYKPFYVAISGIITDGIHALISNIILALIVGIIGTTKGGDLSGEVISTFILSILVTFIIYVATTTIINLVSAPFKGGIKKAIQIVISLLITLPLMVLPYLITYVEPLKDFFKDGDFWKWIVPVINIFMAFTKGAEHSYMVIVPIIQLVILVVLLNYIGSKRLKRSFAL